MAPIVEGPLTITQADGKCTVAIDESLTAGGGSVAGVLSVEGKGSAVVDEVVLINAGLNAMVVKFPSLAAGSALLKAFLDAEIAKA